MTLLPRDNDAHIICLLYTSGCSSLTGVLDLSHTRIETLGKSAFNGCTGLTGVILPKTLGEIGNKNGGRVFYGCTGLQFVRTFEGDSNAIFELPKTLEAIRCV